MFEVYSFLWGMIAMAFVVLVVDLVKAFVRAVRQPPLEAKWDATPDGRHKLTIAIKVQSDDDMIRALGMLDRAMADMTKNVFGSPSDEEDAEDEGDCVDATPEDSEAPSA